MGMVFFNKTTPANEVATMLAAAGVTPGMFVQIIAVSSGAMGGTNRGGNSGNIEFYQGILNSLNHNVTVGVGVNPLTPVADRVSSFGTLVSAAAAPSSAAAQEGRGIGGNGGGSLMPGTGTGGSGGGGASNTSGGGGGFPLFAPLTPSGGVLTSNGLGATGGAGLGGGGSGGGGTGASGGVIVCF